MSLSVFGTSCSLAPTMRITHFVRSVDMVKGMGMRSSDQANHSFYFASWPWLWSIRSSSPESLMLIWLRFLLIRQYGSLRAIVLTRTLAAISRPNPKSVGCLGAPVARSVYDPMVPSPFLGQHLSAMLPALSIPSAKPIVSRKGRPNPSNIVQERS